MNQSKNLIMKSLALTLVLFIFVIPALPSQEYKKVKAEELTPQLTQGSVLAIGSMLLLMMNSNDMITTGVKLTFNEINNFQLDLQQKLLNIDPVGQIVNQANNLGNALKIGADKATIQALTSGALIYAAMESLSNVLFPNQILSSTVPLEMKNSIKDTRYDYKTGRTYEIISTIDITFEDIFYTSYTDNGSGYVWQDNIKDFGNQNASIYIYISELSAESYWSLDYRADKKKLYWYGSTTRITKFNYIKDMLTNNLVKNFDAVNLPSLENVNLPIALPQTVINNITNYDGISDLAIGIPDGYTIPTDNSITVNPGTIVDTPPIDVPVDPPNEPTLIGTVAAILAGIIPISGILDDINVGIDGIATTITGTITDTMTAINEILTEIAAFPTVFNDYMTLPPDVLLPLKEGIPIKFPIIQQFKDAVQLLLDGGERPLIITYPYKGETKYITLEWYEPIRLQVKFAIGLIFQILLTLAVINMVSSILGMPNIGKPVGMGLSMDRDNNEGWRK